MSGRAYRNSFLFRMPASVIPAWDFFLAMELCRRSDEAGIWNFGTASGPFGCVGAHVHSGRAMRETKGYGPMTASAGVAAHEFRRRFYESGKVSKTDSSLIALLSKRRFVW
jgi:hypothetical protein